MKKIFLKKLITVFVILALVISLPIGMYFDVKNKKFICNQDGSSCIRKDE
jgi:hypothetical protein